MLGIGHKLTAAARAAAVGTVSGLLALVGLGFLTLAGWLLLTATYSAVFAATIIGVIYLGFALIGFALMSASDSRPAPTAKRGPFDDLSPLQLVALSFLDGLEQGAKARRQG